MRKLLTVLALLAWCSPAGAGCYSDDSRLTNYIEAMSQQGHEVKSLTPAQRKAFLNAYNSTYPPTAVNYTDVMYIIKGEGVLVILVERECVWITQPAPLSAFKVFIGSDS